MYADLGAIAKAKDTSGEDEGRKFTEGTVRSTVQGEVNRQLQLQGMSYDLEKQIIIGLEGKRVEANIANLKAATNLRSSTKSLNDPLMNDTISALEVDSKKNLRMKAAELLKQTPELRTQAPVTAEAFMQPDYEAGLTAGQLVKIPTEGGGSKLVMYLGVPGMEYLDVFANN